MHPNLEHMAENTETHKHTHTHMFVDSAPLIQVNGKNLAYKNHALHTGTVTYNNDNLLPKYTSEGRATCHVSM